MCLAVPGRVESVEGEGVLKTGRITFAGVTKEASLAFATEARPGDYVLVHAGFAIAVIDEAEAERMLAMIGSLEPEWCETAS